MGLFGHKIVKSCSVANLGKLDLVLGHVEQLESRSQGHNVSIAISTLSDPVYKR